MTEKTSEYKKYVKEVMEGSLLEELMRELDKLDDGLGILAGRQARIGKDVTSLILEVRNVKFNLKKLVELLERIHKLLVEVELDENDSEGVIGYNRTLNAVEAIEQLLFGSSYGDYIEIEIFGKPFSEAVKEALEDNKKLVEVIEKILDP